MAAPRWPPSTGTLRSPPWASGGSPLLRRRTPHPPAISQPRRRHPVNLQDTEAEREGWTGEAEGLKVSLDAANNKIAQADMTAARRAETADLGIPAYRDIAAVTITAPGNRP